MALVVYAALAAVGAAAFFAARLYAIWSQREEGCDAFYILLQAEAIRAQRRFPPRLPGLFLLEDDEQWYPPVFLTLCALAPQDWLKRRYWLFNQIVDLANAALLFVAVAALTDSAWAAAGAVVAYGVSAGLVNEFAALTTRPLGLFVLNSLIFSGALAAQNPAWIPLALAAGILLVYAHKLSAQQAWVALPLIFAATGDWIWLALGPGMYAAAFLVWPRGCRGVIGGHIAIVRFWSRNWPWLVAHAVRQSPVYGDGGKTRQDFYAPVRFAPIRFAKEALHQNYFAVPALFACGEQLVSGGGLGGVSTILAVWLVAVYLAAGATHFIHKLRGLGLGRQYVKFGLAPSLCLTALSLTEANSPLAVALAVAASLLSARQYRLVARSLRQRTEGPLSGAAASDLRTVLAKIREAPDARVLVLPYQQCDLVAYHTRRPVYWGTHGQDFNERFERFFPVLRERIDWYVSDGGLTHLLLDSRYVDGARDLDLRPDTRIVQVGAYELYRLPGRRDIADRAGGAAMAGRSG